MKLEICNFSGYKIYPGHGKTFVRSDSRVFKLLNGKCEAHFLLKKNPRKYHWTVVFRRLHKKGITEEVAKKRSKRTVKHQRAVVGASWDQIKAKRNQSEEVRQAARAKAQAAKTEAAAKKKAEKVKLAASHPAAPAKIKAPKQTKAPRPSGNVRR